MPKTDILLPRHHSCVDINPAVVTKLADRGSSQTAGIVTDVGLFLHQLSLQINGERAPEAPLVATASDVGSAGGRS